MVYDGFKFGSPENIYFLVVLRQVPFFVFLYLITYFTKKATEEGDELTKINEIFKILVFCPCIYRGFCLLFGVFIFYNLKNG